MIPLPVKVTTNSVPASFTVPDDMQGVLEAVPKFTNYALNDSGPPVVVNPNAAGATLAGLWVWTRSPVPSLAEGSMNWLMTGYQNTWWRLYSGKPREVSIFVGYPYYYFDSSGRGLQDTGWEGWALCNGNNGTINYQNYFSVPGYRYDGYGWVTHQEIPNLPPTSQPGDFYGSYYPSIPWEPWLTIWSSHYQITLNDLPQMFLAFNAAEHFSTDPNVTGGLWNVTAQGVVDGTAGKTVVIWPYPVTGPNYVPTGADTPFSRLPPYIAVGYAMFIGY